IESERQTLLRFEEGIEDSYNQLNSWTRGSEECCRWRGIKCNNDTGHLVMIDLRPNVTPSYWSPFGKIGSSLIELRYLNGLDLSYNAFTNIPKFIGLVSKLTCLNLSYNCINGTILDQLGNLSRLHTLDLTIGFECTMKVASLVELVTLNISRNTLTGIIPKGIGQLRMLKSLDLSGNKLQGKIPGSLAGLSYLSYLNLSSNNLSGKIPSRTQ
ncbi:LOW QUALITY PROTEIN: LRR_1 domain-containing protein/LRRNT_2 domain-containing protein/LRR_6 domain-containing protein/LRR_8 domain-containing protein, partial [Cephalotus follicularis]